jgi:hypothetical protein
LDHWNPAESLTPFCWGMGKVLVIPVTRYSNVISTEKPDAQFVVFEGIAFLMKDRSRSFVGESLLVDHL